MNWNNFNQFDNQNSAYAQQQADFNNQQRPEPNIDPRIAGKVVLEDRAGNALFYTPYVPTARYKRLMLTQEAEVVVSQA